MQFTFKSLIAFAVLYASSTSAAAVPSNDVSTEGMTSPISSLVARDGSVHCYHVGYWADRSRMISAINEFCGARQGVEMHDGKVEEIKYSLGGSHIIVSARGRNGCKWHIDQTCYSHLRQPTDRCNTAGENFKQGGTYTDHCAQFRMDPEAW